MPLRYIRRKVTAENVVAVAVATTAAATNLAALAGFPPVALPAAILLKIFQVLRNVQTNQDKCYDLAFRCLSFLDLIRDQVIPRQAEAPPSLFDALEKFSNTLESIHLFLTSVAESNWRTRLVHKGSMQTALASLHWELDNAFSAFQIATLINIHYAVGDGHTMARTTEKSTALPTSYSSPLDEKAPGPVISNVSESHETQPSSHIQQVTKDIKPSPSSRLISVDPKLTLVHEPLDGAVFSENSDELEVDALEEYGFLRYDQTDIAFKDGSHISQGWWAGARRADVEERNILFKGYSGARNVARNRWVRDVKILQNVFHPNLPQLVGFSGEECPTPFILLANFQTRLPQALVLNKIRNGTLAECVLLITRFYLDHMDAALYLQRQLHLSDEKTQDYVENASFSIDGPQTLVMGLPPPEVDHWTSARNYDLAYSVRRVYLDLLPNRGMNAQRPYRMIPESDTSIEMQCRINHLTHALNAFLPGSHSSAHVSELETLLSVHDDDAQSTTVPLSLRDIRMISLKLGASPPVWREPFVPAYRYLLGDLGYLKKPGDFASFKLICNPLQDGLVASTPIMRSQHGTQIQWSRTPSAQIPLSSFPCTGNRQGWAVVLEPNADCTVVIAHEERLDPTSHILRVLWDHGPRHAMEHGVRPEELILINRVGVDLRFRMKGPYMPLMQHHSYQTPAFSPNAYQVHMSHMPPHAFGHQQMGHPLGLQPTPGPPTIIYLSTSIDEASQPTWSDSPVFNSETKPVHNIANCMISTESPLGFLNYIQLHSEDFLSIENGSLESPCSTPVLARGS